MGLVFQTVLFVFVNVIIASLLLLANAETLDQTVIDNPFNDTDSSISYGDIKDTGSYMVTDSDFEGTGIPSWLTGFLLLIDGIWFLALMFGWIRGQH